MDQEQIAHFERLFSSLSQRMEQGFAAVDRRFDAVDRRFDKMEDEVHKTRILFEALEDKVKMVAEGVDSVREELRAHKAEVNARFDKVDKRLLAIEANARTSYEDLISRIRKRQSPEPKGPKDL